MAGLAAAPAEVQWLLGIIVVVLLWGTLPLPAAWRLARRECQALDTIEAVRPRVSAEAADRLLVRTGIEAETNVKVLRPTATAERVRSLARIVEYGLPLDRASLTAAAEDRLTEPLRRPRAVSGMLVLIGLAGTLLGLTQAVLGLGSFGGVQPAAPPGGSIPVTQLIQQQSDVINHLLDSIQSTLRGMQTAFIPALAAVILTVLLLLMVYAAQARAEHAAARLEALTDEILLPLYRPGAENRLQEAQFLAFRAANTMVAAAERTASLLVTALDNMDARMAAASDAVTETIQAGSREAIESLKTFVGESRAAVDETARILTTGAKSAATQFSTAATDAAQSVAAVHKRMQKSAERLEKTTDALAASVETAGAAASEISAVLRVGGRVAERLSEAEGHHRETVKLTTEQLQAARQEATRVAETSARFAEALQNLDQTRLAMRDLVALQQQWHRDTLGAVDANTRGAEESAREVRTAIGRIEETARTLEHRIERVHLPDPAQRDQRLMDYLAEVVTQQNRVNEEHWLALMRKLDTSRAVAPVPAVIAHPDGPQPGRGLDGTGVITTFINRIRNRFR
jgi:hypothetical protein